MFIAIVVLLSGCALQDTRYDNSGIAAGFGPDYDQTIIDWNFPTSHNQGPLLAPERFRPVRPAIGVPWATGNPMPWQQGDGAKPEGAQSSAVVDEPRACADVCADVAVANTAPVARAGEHSVLAERR